MRKGSLTDDSCRALLSQILELKDKHPPSKNKQQNNNKKTTKNKQNNKKQTNKTNKQTHTHTHTHPDTPTHTKTVYIIFVILYNIQQYHVMLFFYLQFTDKITSSENTSK